MTISRIGSVRAVALTAVARGAEEKGAREPARPAPISRFSQNRETRNAYENQDQWQVVDSPATELGGAQAGRFKENYSRMRGFL